MRQGGRRHAGEDGYAMVAAVAAIALFAMMAVALVRTNQTVIGDAAADYGQAKAAAAADAGFVLALGGLLAEGRADRWSIDGRARALRFEDADLKIRVEDERGKVPLNLLDEETAARLVAAGGLSGERARIAADSLLDWTDDDDEPRGAGAEAIHYRGQGIHPRNGPLESIDELAQVRGFDAAVVDRLRDFVTVNFGTGGFDARFGQPRAIGVMLPGGDGNPAALSRERELSGQRTAIEIGDSIDLTGRPLTIVVEATRPDGSRALRRTVVELTGAAQRPYIIRSFG